MRIIFNAYAAVTPPLTGVGHYARRLLQGLDRLEPSLDLTCFADGCVIATPRDSDEPPPPPGPLWQGPARRALRSLSYRVPYLRRVQTRLGFLRLRARHRGAIYHEPNHILLPYDGPSVVTIHDISVLHYPHFHPRQRVAYFNRHLRETLARADRIITDSAFISRDLQTTLGVAPERIRIVPLGVTADFRPLPRETLAPLIARLGLTPGGYLLAMGTREPRKNLETLLAAYLALPQALRARAPLALAGPRGWRADALEARMDALAQAGEIRRLGYVPDVARAALYAGAVGLAYPSLYEGFGLPPLEAACCGIPVLTSRESPMEETLGEAALLVDPRDAGAITAGLARLLDDPSLREDAARRAPALSARFTWQACAERTAAIYRELDRPT
jgi:alpha-1,3-rhamnosyl/mannosyltransferase